MLPWSQMNEFALFLHSKKNLKYFEIYVVWWKLSKSLYYLIYSMAHQPNIKKLNIQLRI